MAKARSDALAGREEEAFELTAEGGAANRRRATEMLFDGAYLRTLSPLPGTWGAAALAGAGVGLTLKAEPGFSLRGDLAWPLVSIGAQSAGLPRVQASAAYQF